MLLDYVIVGGGLSGALLALAIGRHSPLAAVALLERATSVGGNHLWSFHADDVPRPAASIVEPLVVRSWPKYHVAFPGFTRTVDAPYASISSERLEHVTRRALGDDVVLGANVVRIQRDRVELGDGRVFRARLVIDARGPETLQARGDRAFQKFAGVELRVRRAPALPMLMDATVEQRDGFRFLYVLPLADDRVLVEDTRFSLSPSLDVGDVTAQALSWAADHDLDGDVVRREHGVLPLPLDPLPSPPDDGVLHAGYAGGWFHPTTGYSLPAAIRLALHVATREPERALGADLDRLVRELRTQQRFCVLLNRLLYRAVPEEDRWRVLERFHRLPAPAIARFYSLSLTRADRARILCGRPPAGVSLRKALQELTA